MIGSDRTGSSFGGLARYLLHGREGEVERGAWVALRNLVNEDPEKVAAEMEATASQAARVREPVYHLSLSAPAEERLSREQWEAIADRVLRDLGLERHQAMIVAHQDRDHHHVHLMVNRVHPEERVAWRGSFSHVRIERSLRHLEREMGLREVPGRLFQLSGQERPERGRGLTSGERRERERTGEKVAAERFRERTGRAFREARSWGELEHRLGEKGLRLEKRGRGLVVTDGRRRVKASRVDRGGSIHRLEARFGMGFREWRVRVGELRGKVGELEAVAGGRRRLLDEEARLSGKARRAQDQVDTHRRLAREAEKLRAGLDRRLREVYRPPDLGAVQRRLDELVRRRGWAQAAEVLRRRPEELGRLRGRGVGPMESRERRAALAAAERAGGTLAGLGRVQGELGRASRRSAAAARTIPRLDVRLRQVGGRLEELSRGKGEESLRRDVAHLATRIGVASLRFVLPEPASRLVSAAVRVASMARDLGRGFERTLER